MSDTEGEVLSLTWAWSLQASAAASSTQAFKAGWPAPSPGRYALLPLACDFARLLCVLRAQSDLWEKEFQQMESGEDVPAALDKEDALDLRLRHAVRELRAAQRARGGRPFTCPGREKHLIKLVRAVQGDSCSRCHKDLGKEEIACICEAWDFVACETCTNTGLKW